MRSFTSCCFLIVRVCAFAPFLGACNTLVPAPPNLLDKASVQNASASLPTRELAELSAVVWQSLPGTGQRQSFEINLNNPVVAVDGERFYATGFLLEADQIPVRIELNSLAGEDSILVPEMTVLDSAYQALEKTAPSQAEYHPARLLEPDRLHLQRIVGSPQARYLLIHSSPPSLGGTTRVSHPARLHAEARGTTPPTVDDIELVNAPVGMLTISAEIASANPARRETSGPDKPATGSATGPVPLEDQPHDAGQGANSTEASYRLAITRAVRLEDLESAMTLVEESERQGIKGMRQAFIEAIRRFNTPKQMTPVRPEE